MGEYVVKLPDVGEGIAEAEIVEWHVAVGESIAEDQVMVEVMTDKATVELPSPVSGAVVWLGGVGGDILAVGAPLIRIDVGGGDSIADPMPPPPGNEQATEPPSEPDPPPTADVPPIAAAPRPQGSARPTAAPAVRQRADSLGIDLSTVVGTGPDGRVVHADLDTHLMHDRPPSTRTTRIPPGEATDDIVDSVPVTGLRRNIARRMQVAKARIPHFTYGEEIDVTEVERLRAELNERYADERSRLTVLPFLMRAMVIAIGDFPQMNARYDDDSGVVSRHRSVHLGIATQTPKGLMVPVVAHAESRDLWDCADEVTRLSTAARDHKITIEELSGSTITISSLGSLGGIVSTPIINYPEVAIVGVNKISTRPVYVQGALLPRQIMNLSSSFDHRVVDGADAAAFIQRIKGLLESPALMFMS